VEAEVMRALAHAHLHWLVQLVAAVLATLLAAAAWSAWPIWIGLLLALAAAARFTWRDFDGRPLLAFAACVAGQLPGLTVALVVAAGFARVLGEPYASMAWLQAWTSPWTPVWSLLPDTTFHRRGLYAWSLPVLPFVQLALMLAMSRVRAHADSRG
jgi:hypothetical protein